MSSINPLPTIPTDNYHKFRALAGLWLIIGALGAGFGALLYFERELLELKTQEVKADVDSDDFAREVKLKALDAPSPADDIALKEEDARLNAARESLSQDVNGLKAEVMNGRLEHNRAGDLAARDKLAQVIRTFAEIRSESESLTTRRTALMARRIAYARDVGNTAAKWSFLRKDLRVLKVKVEYEEELIIVVWTMLGFVVLGASYGLRLTVTGFREWKSIQAIQDEGLRLSLKAPAALPKAVSDVSAKQPVVEPKRSESGEGGP